VFSFARNAWISTIVATALLLVVTPLRSKGRLAAIIVGAAVGAILFSFAVAAVTPRRSVALKNALAERFLSIVQTRRTSSEPSVENRRYENRAALRLALRQPVFGLGLRTTIKQTYEWVPTARGMRMVPLSTYMIHNSYLDMWVHYGLLGVLSFAAISITFLYRAFSLWRRAEEYWVKSIGLGFALGYVTLLIRSVVVMTLLHQLWEITVAAYMWGMVEAGFLLAVKPKESPASAAELPAPATSHAYRTRTGALVS